ncbi:MAG: hypothetical protein Q9220_006236 [cf. Caloplaca sp. 1 TL-2023]
MAPSVKKRSSIRSRASTTGKAASNPASHILPTTPKAHGSFGSTKKDKRIIRHSALISRIEKSKPQFKKPRRPSKKLVTNLESLAHALPDIPASTTETPIAKIRHRSLKSQPGAMRKKEKIIAMEKDRFNQNMAQMTASRGSTDQSASRDGNTRNISHTASKWAALRTFIQQNMEQRPDT